MPLLFSRHPGKGRDPWLEWIPALAGITVIAAALFSRPAAADEEPKHGGTLTYMIPADAPPSFDGHRESTYATVHSVAPFYSVLIRVNPENPSSTTDLVCDLCTEMPQPTDGGKNYTFKIRQHVKFHDGSPLTAADVAASFNEIVFPPEGVLSARASNYLMVDKIEAPDPETVIFHLKFATSAFLPALASPFNWIYKKAILDQDPRWYEKNILGSGPFKFAGYETGQSIRGVRNPEYYHKGLPYLDGFTGIYAAKQAVRVDAIRSDRAAIEFRGMPPAARDELVRALGDKITVQEGDWDVASAVTPNHKKKPFDNARVRRALSLATRPLGRSAGIIKDCDRQDRRRPRLSRLVAGGNQRGTRTDCRVLARYREITGRGAAIVEGGRRRGAFLRTPQPRCRSAL